jgi:hypothetical protein
MTAPAPVRAEARIVFIRALARLTDAIANLRAWRLPESELETDHERELRSIDGGHPFFRSSFEPGPGSLFGLAGEPRVAAALDWGRRWNLDVPWLRSWAVFALLVWDVQRWCSDPNCEHRCATVRSDEDLALGATLSDRAMMAFGEEPLLISILRSMQAKESSVVETLPESREGLLKYLPPHKRIVLPAFPGPHPLLETKDEFLAAMRLVWDEAVSALEHEGVSLRAPRKLSLHGEWLVRFHVRGETAAQILEGIEDTDPSTIYKAVKSVAHLIDLPLRVSPQG